MLVYNNISEALKILLPIGTKYFICKYLLLVENVFSEHLRHQFGTKKWAPEFHRGFLFYLATATPTATKHNTSQIFL